MLIYHVPGTMLGDLNTSKRIPAPACSLSHIPIVVTYTAGKEELTEIPNMAAPFRV